MLKEKLLYKKFLFFTADSSLKAVINCIPSHSRSLSTIQYAGSVKISNVSSLEEFKAGFEKKKKTKKPQKPKPTTLTCKRKAFCSLYSPKYTPKAPII